MASLMPQGKQQYFDSNGNPLAGGKLYAYAAGTTTPQDTYSDAAGAVPNTNPVVMNARGEASVFFGPSAYKVVLKDASDVEIYTQDNLQAQIGTADLASTAVGKGAALIGTSDGGTVATSLISKINRVVDSITALRALDKTKYTRAFVTGYYAAGDGGGGPYWYDSTDTTSADNGGTIIVATDGGRWKLQIVGYLSVRQFGAKGDWNGTSGTDDTTAIQAAITATNGDVFFPLGKYKITTALTINGKTTTLIGEGMQATEIVCTTTNSKILSFTGQWGGFKDLSLDYSGTPVAGATAVYSTSANLVADRFHIKSCHTGIEVTTGPAQHFSRFFIDNYVSIGIYAHAVNDCYFEQFICDAKNATNGALGGLRLFDKAEAIMFTSGSVLNGVFSLTTDATAYTQGNRPAYCKFVNVFMDSAAQGCSLDKLVETSFSNAWFSNGRSGGGFPGCKLLQTDSVTFNAGSNFFNCGSHGLHITSASARTVVVDSFAESNSITAGAGVSDGIHVDANTNDFTIKDNICRNGLYTGGQQGYGIKIDAGTSARYLVSGNNLASNATGGLSDGGTGALSRVSDNVGYNPVGMSAITVGASPYTYFSGNTRETIYITGGTVSGVNLPGGAIYGAGTDRTVTLEPGEQVTVFYTGVPTMWKYRH